MDFLLQPPELLARFLPEGAARIAWYAILGAIALLLLLGVWKVLGRRKTATPATPKLEEDLSTYPDARPSTGDRQLRVEGVPVRMRLVVAAPAGNADDVALEDVEALLDKVVPGMTDICKGDKPRIKVWPRQLSYEGFAKHFQRNMIVAEPKGQPSRWVLIGGRVKLGKQQIMLGLALQAVKPTTMGRRTVDAHEWPTVLRVRVKD